MLLGNVTLLSRNPLRFWGQTLQGEPGNFGQTGPRRNSSMGEASVSGETAKASIPSGYRHPDAWMLPNKGGALAARLNLRGEGVFSGAGARGVNGEGSISGSGAVSGTAQLVVSGSATIAGTGSFSGSVVAVLAASASLTGSGTLSGTPKAIGHQTAALSGSGTVTLTSYATGKLEAAITPAVTLTAEQFAAQLLDIESVESGMTVREALKLMSAAMAGKISGAAGATVTIRSAVADDKDRIVASVDSSGNRTAITYDLS